MSVTSAEVVAETGKRLLSTKLYSTSMYSMWIYDYFLTFGDEVTYAWSGRKSWVFALFITNRYLPILHIIYKGIIMFDFTIPLCQDTKWELTLYTLIAAFLAQLTVALRLYAITGRNKLVGGVLAALLVAQVVAGVSLTVVAGSNPIQSLPQIDLDAFRVCLFQQWKPGEISFVTVAVAFDVFALCTIFLAARGPRVMKKHPGIPSLFRTILRDATIYFLLMFACQLLLLFFLFLAPVQLQLLPGVTHTMFLPMMACRLMLSLKKAASEPRGLWTLTETPQVARARTIEFVAGTTPRTFDVSYEISDTLPLSSNEEGVELGTVTRLTREGGSSQLSDVV